MAFCLQICRRFGDLFGLRWRRLEAHFGYGIHSDLETVFVPQDGQLFAQSLMHIATVCLWALACLSVGAFVGLLFGIPRMRQMNAGQQISEGQGDGTGKPAKFQPEVNNNLIEVSDWLTKIIVGLGLIELRGLPGRLKSIAQPLADCLGNDCGLAIAVSVLVFFTFAGFLAGYINTRTAIAIMFRRSDDALLDENIAERLAKAKEVNEFEPSLTEILKKITSTEVVAKLAVDSKPESVREFLQQQVAQIKDQIKQESCISVDLKAFGTQYGVKAYPVAALRDMGALTDAVYVALQGSIRPYAYGVDWVLRDKATKRVIAGMRMLTKTPVGIPVTDSRSLESMGITAGMELEAVKPRDVSDGGA